MKIVRLAKLATRIAASNAGELPLPYRLTYAVTDRCQARCTMCGIWQKPIQNELTIEEIDSLFRKANHFSWINLTGGELLQRPDIRQVIATIIDNSPNLYLLNFPTNGIQTDEIVSTVAMILEKTRLPRLIVSVSLDGPEELHDRIRGTEGCWRNAIETFRQLRKWRSGRFSVYFGHTIQTLNLGMFDLTVEAADSRIDNVTVDDFHLNIAHASGHYYDNTATGALPDQESAVREIERIASARTRKPFDPVARIEQSYQRHIRHYLEHGRACYTCQAAAASCFINPVGIVYPCSVFDSPIGSLREYGLDFAALWHSKARTQSRIRIINGHCPGCWTPCEAYQTILANLLKQGLSSS